MVLYNARVFCFEKCQDLHAHITTADNDVVSQFIDNDIRNHIACLELQHMNDKGDFLYLHPLLKHTRCTDDLEKLFYSDPSEFSKQMINASKSVSRYRTKLKTKLTDASLSKYTNLLHLHEDKYTRMLGIIDSKR